MTPENVQALFSGICFGLVAIILLRERRRLRRLTDAPPPPMPAAPPLVAAQEWVGWKRYVRCPRCSCMTTVEQAIRRTPQDAPRARATCADCRLRYELLPAGKPEGSEVRP